VRSSCNLRGLNLIILPRFVDHDMLMRYYWGLGIGHSYSHVAVSTDSQSCSTSQQPCSSKNVTEDYGCCGNDEMDEGKNLNASGTQMEQDSAFEFEPEGSESSTDSQSDSESVLGDHVDMYGCGLNALGECDEF